MLPRSLSFLFMTLVVLAALTLFPVADARATMLLRVTVADKADLAQLGKLAPESRDEGAIGVEKGVEFPAPSERLTQLRAAGFQVEVVQRDLESFYASRMAKKDSNFGAFHTYYEAIASMDSLAAAHPDIMTSKFSIGTTIEGRPLWVYKISDNPNIDEDEPEIFFSAFIHAREVITFEVLFDMTKYLVNGYGTDTRATNMVNTREIFIEPVINPDGVEYNHTTNPSGGGLWRKNRHHNSDGSYGIDLNRNFGYDWGYDDVGSSPTPSSETYRGTGPFSEPETAAIRDFCIARPFKITVSYHSYGGYELYPWSRTDIHCPDNEVFFALGRLRRATSGYTVGTSWEVLYTTNGGSTDWGYGDTTSKPMQLSIVTEVGTQSDGFWPAESRIPALCAENREKNLRMIELADNPWRVLAPGMAVVTSPDSIATTSILTWNVPTPDADNPAASWNLVEATGRTVGQDNLEGTNANRWTPDGWTWTTSKYHSSNHSYFSGNTAYLHNVLISRRGHKVLAGEQLKFWTWYNMESGYDYGFVEVATNGRDYTPIAGSITTNSDPNVRNPGNGVNGSTSSAWVQATFPLTAYVGQTIWVRFRYSTDSGVNSGGWYVDDIEPSDLFTTETTLASGLTFPEYAFTDHAEGIYSYLVQSVDPDGDTSDWSAPRQETFYVSTTGVNGGGELAGRTNLELLGSNPFSGTARLRLTLPSSAHAGEPWNLRVLNVAGRSVAHLLSGRIDASATSGRTFEVQWSPDRLPSGIYLARLGVGTQAWQQRLVYLK